MRYPLTPVRMANINDSGTTDVGKDAEKEELLHCWWEHKLVQPLENSRYVPQKIKEDYPTTQKLHY